MSKPSAKTIVISGIIIALLAITALITGLVLVKDENKNKVQTAEIAASSEPVITEYDPATAEQWVRDAVAYRTLGNENAPITIIDYSSLTCPHCADFHLKVLPELKKEYIDTGKAKLVFADFPLNLPALQASALTRCIVDKDAYFATIDQLFRTQGEWSASENARGSLINSVKFSGLSREDAAKCIDNPVLISGLLQQQDEAKTKYSIESTPTFILLKGDKTDKVQGARPFADFKAALDKL